MTYRTFTIQLLILTALLALLLAAINFFIPFFTAIQHVTWFALLFFLLLTLLTGYLGFRSIEKSAYGFVSTVNGMVMLKLFLCIGFVIGYLLMVKPATHNFIFPFFILYVIYTVFEIRQLVVAQKKQAQQRKSSQHAGN